MHHISCINIMTLFKVINELFPNMYKQQENSLEEFTVKDQEAYHLYVYWNAVFRNTVREFLALLMRNSIVFFQMVSWLDKKR